MIPADLTRDIIQRLNRLGGQLAGITRMLEKGHDPQQILNQFKAVEGALQRTRQLLLDEAMRKALALKIVEAKEACPGNCGQEDNITRLLREFPRLGPEQVPGRLQEVRELQKRLTQNKTGPA